MVVPPSRNQPPPTIMFERFSDIIFVLYQSFPTYYSSCILHIARSYKAWQQPSDNTLEDAPYTKGIPLKICAHLNINPFF